jgi:putative Holliday junction resolvase
VTGSVAVGAILGLDFGTKRLGVAVTDRERRFVFARPTRPRAGLEADCAFLKSLADSEGVDLVVIGLPLHAGGEEGAMASEARRFGAEVGRALGLPVAFVDERFTSLDAEETLRARFPRDTRARRARRDQVAASLILQTYLESGPHRAGPQSQA